MSRAEYPEYSDVNSSKKRAKFNKEKKKVKIVIKDTFKKLCALWFNQISDKKGIKTWAECNKCPSEGVQTVTRFVCFQKHI